MVLAVAPLAFGTTSDALTITSAGLTATITDNGACVGTGCGSLTGDVLSGTDGTIFVTGSIGGWSITYSVGVSNSPSLEPFALDVGSLTASCTGTCSGAGALSLAYSDINFNPAPSSFQTDYSTTMTGSGTGTTSESAYFSNTNTLFAQTTLIGTVGPFTGTNAGTATGGVGATAPYSLTLVQTFSATGTKSFSNDGSLTGVPEPASVSMLGGVLLVAVTAIRRKMRRA
jgi:hypothetical protein